MSLLYKTSNIYRNDRDRENSLISGRMSYYRRKESFMTDITFRVDNGDFITKDGNTFRV